MDLRIILFEDNIEDQVHFTKEFKDNNIPFIMIDHCEELSKEELDEINKLKPNLAIVDCHFGSETIDGINIVEFLNDYQENILIIICTKYVDIPNSRNRIMNDYENLPGVIKILGKNPMPSIHDIIVHYNNFRIRR